MVNLHGQRVADAVRRRGARVRRIVEHIGPAPSPDQVTDDANRYWLHQEADPVWEGNSHWRSGLSEDDWLTVGREHMAIFHTFAQGLGLPARPGAVVEWGCGGGANAVAFAPDADSFLAVDVSKDSVDECLRQVAAVCDTPIEGAQVDIRHPERVVAGRENAFDTFMCLYVVEVLPSPEEAARILRIAASLLRPGGLALVQMKYHGTDWRPRRYKRNYRRYLSTMTTFGIDEFWNLATECGLTPRLVTLVPRNHLDTRYAYYALTKSDGVIGE
jgi:SAM-dependent methyltransferase